MTYGYMKTDKNGELPGGAELAGPLVKVLGRSERVKRLVAECAEALSLAIRAIKHELPNWNPVSGIAVSSIAAILKRGEAVESKVQEASAEMSMLSQELKIEARDRDMVDHQFAAAQEQGIAARHAAFHDVLTGLPNRALFNNRLEHAFAQARRHGWTLAVMFVDLDDFKIINDTHGHAAGDDVIRTIARRLQEITRGEDTVSRVGGDEFLYLLTEIRDEAHIAMVAAKLIQAIQAPCHLSVRGLELAATVRASIGISIFPKDGATADALVRSADQAMYRAKQDKSGCTFAQGSPSK
jgi:diguanylate cyclase (GGDEF)-like protein